YGKLFKSSAATTTTTKTTTIVNNIFISVNINVIIFFIRNFVIHRISSCACSIIHTTNAFTNTFTTTTATTNSTIPQSKSIPKRQTERKTKIESKSESATEFEAAAETIKIYHNTAIVISSVVVNI
ncbi:unnamed protein product, partial [Ceratitis capitata]